MKTGDPNITDQHKQRRIVLSGRKLLCLPIILSGLVSISSGAQTNTGVLSRGLASRIAVLRPMVTRVSTNANPNLATVELKLPEGSSLTNYRVIEHQAGVARAASRVTAKSTNEVSASLATGSTLMFVERGTQPRIRAGSPAGRRQLFSTYFVKAMAPLKPGQPSRAAAGTLNLFTDEPIVWNAASNAYVAYLTVTFSADDTATTSPLLPLAVDLSGHNTSRIDPRHLELEKANDSKYAVVSCDQYQTDVVITAHYLTASNTVPLELQKLTPWSMTQMIISKPMLFAALTGGLIGGLLRLFKGGKWGLPRTLRILAEGATVGLVTVTMLLAGLLHAQMAELPAQPQMVLGFALAAAAGSVGAHFLDKAVGHLRGK